MGKRIKKIFSKIFFNKRKFFVLLAIFFVVGVVLFALCPKGVNARADVVIGRFVAKTLVNIYLPFINLLMNLVVVIIDMLIGVLQYNDFIDAAAVEKGWVLVRDICNLFFVFLLLYNAFLLVLGINKGDPQKNVLQILLMAVLINFSKMICGLLIDFSQVIMLSFVYAFRGNAANRLTEALKVDTFMDLNKKNISNNAGDEESWVNMVMALSLAFIVVTLTVVVLLALTLMMIIRIVMLWILVALSPLAFIMGLVPFGKKFASRWWDKFTKQLVLGPVMAFFLWLMLAIVQKGDSGLATQFNKVDTGSGQVVQAITEDTSGITATINTIGDSETLLSFALALIMLVVSMGMAKEFGTFGGAAIMSKATNLWKGGMRKFGQTHARLGHLASEKVFGGIGKRMQRSSNPVVEKIGQGASQVGALSKEWNKNIGKGNRKKRDKVRVKILDKLNMGQVAEERLRTWTTRKGPNRSDKPIFILKGLERVLSKRTSEEKAKKAFVKNAETIDDHMGSIKKNEFIGSAGLRKKQKDRLDKLDKSNTGSQKWADFIRDNHTDRRHKNSIQEVAKALAVLEKENGGLNELGVVKTALQSTGNTEFDPASYSQLGMDPYRKTGVEKQKTEVQDISVSSNFANGKSDRLAVDFRDIKSAMDEEGSFDGNFDDKASGVNLNNDQDIAAVAPAIVDSIDKKINSLDPQKDASKIERLEKAKSRLSNPEELENLELINNGVDIDEEKSGRKRVVHENLHSSGLEDEDATEDLTQEIVANRMYSFADDIGRAAAIREEAGKSLDFDSVIGDVRTNLESQKELAKSPEQKERIQGRIDRLDAKTGESRVDRVIANENDPMQDVEKELSGGGAEVAKGEDATVISKLEDIHDELKDLGGKGDMGEVKLAGQKQQPTVEEEIKEAKIADQSMIDKASASNEKDEKATKNNLATATERGNEMRADGKEGEVVLGDENLKATVDEKDLSKKEEPKEKSAEDKQSDSGEVDQEESNNEDWEDNEYYDDSKENEILKELKKIKENTSKGNVDTMNFFEE